VLGVKGKSENPKAASPESVFGFGPRLAAARQQ
jgi:hypothetical protein